MIYVMNYADGQPYESYRKYNTLSAKLFGRADSVIEYTKNDIDKDYIHQHKEIFTYKRGAGLWLWKPYLINKALRSLNEGDWLFYADAGVTFIRSLHYLVRLAEKNYFDIMTFEQPMLCRQFTKRECYKIMGVEDHNENQTLGLLLLRKSEESVRFIDEWLSLCEVEELLSPKHFHSEIEEWPDFYAHREDQSLLSLLRTKWSLPSFRDCSDYGVMPFMYANSKYSYHPLTYNNSDYPTIILCNRKTHPVKYLVIYLIKRIVSTMGIFYTGEKVLAKRGVVKKGKSIND